MRWTLVLAIVFIITVCEAGRVKREHKKHRNNHHNHHAKTLDHHHAHTEGAGKTNSHHNSGHKKNSLHLKRVSGCNCPRGQVCVDGSGKGQPLCVNKHFLKQGERLYETFRKHHLEHSKHERHHQLATPQAPHLGGHPNIHLERPHDVAITVHAKHHDNRHHNDARVKGEHILESHQLSGLMNAKHHKKHTPVCSHEDLTEMRQRLTGWFRLLHAEEKEEHHHQHHGNHHKKHKHLSVKKELRDHHDGRCKAQPSVMWEMHRLDEDNDHHLSSAELSVIENNNREPCLRPFLESCDTDRDGKLSRHEWRCCFADAIAPCYAKLRIAEREMKLESASYIPRCDREGYFEKEQCRGRTMETRTCWCVDLNGNRIPNTRSRVRAHCEKIDVLGHMKKKN